MLTVLISDDEPDVCQLIMHLIEWDVMGLELAGTAGNGIECFEKIRKLKPDIVITDIRMPGLDGLDLIKKTYEEGIYSHFIIISGYQQFEYARRAIRYDVEDYLLKPVGKRELNRCLENIIAKIYAKQEKDFLAEEKELLYQGSRKQLQGQLFDALLYHPESIREMNIDELNKKYHTDFKEGNYLALCVQAEGGKEEDAVSVLRYAENTFAHILARWRMAVSGLEEESRLYGIINYEAEEEKDVCMAAETMFRTIQAYAKEERGILLTCTLSSRKRKPGEFSDMLMEAKRAVSWRLICDSERLIDAASMKPESVSLEQILSQQMKHTIENAAAALDTDKMCQAVDAVFHKFRGIRRGDPWVLYEFCSYMETVIRMSLKNSKINLEIKEGILAEGSCYDLGDFCVCMKRQAGEIFEKLRTESRENDNRPIRIAKQYISEHYMEPVRLTEIAELVHMNAAYFSTVFKKETGISFSDYVTEQRMVAAKELLQASSLSVNEIAEKVGYTETAYFSRLFKKQVGIKPSQYRNLHS